MDRAASWSIMPVVYSAPRGMLGQLLLPCFIYIEKLPMSAVCQIRSGGLTILRFYPCFHEDLCNKKVAFHAALRTNRRHWGKRPIRDDLHCIVFDQCKNKLLRAHLYSYAIISLYMMQRTTGVALLLSFAGTIVVMWYFLWLLIFRYHSPVYSLLRWLALLHRRGCLHLACCICCAVPILQY